MGERTKEHEPHHLFSSSQAKKEARETILPCYSHHALHPKFLISSSISVLEGMSQWRK